MRKPVSVLTINGSPHDSKSNTRGFVDDFLTALEKKGVQLERQTISLGTMNLKPCQGCWACTRGKACPVKDDLKKIKSAMIACDMLILASPVYTNQVTAQMKTLFDRLFTWCHVFPLLGKFGLTAVTTGNDGHRETAAFLEKMMATYGISSFGALVGTGGMTSGFYPRRESELEKNQKLIDRTAKYLLSRETVPVTVWNRKIFKVMKRKLMGINIVRYISHSQAPGSPPPAKSLLKLVEKRMKKGNMGPEQVEKLSKLMDFEYNWWLDRSWMTAGSFGKLRSIPVPEGFNIQERLLTE